MKQYLEHSSFHVSSSLKNETVIWAWFPFRVKLVKKWNGSLKHGLLLGSSLCKNETYEHSSSPMSSSLKNETDPSPIESSFLWNLGLEPSFHSLVLLDFLSPLVNVFPLVTMSQIGWRKESMNELKLGGHATSLYWSCWGTIPTSGHHVGKEPTDGYLSEHSLFSGSSSFKKWNQHSWANFYVFHARVKYEKWLSDL